MPNEADSAFYKRADEHIELSNKQLAGVDNGGMVSASMMFATARYNAWISARQYGTREELAANREEALKYFCEQYRLALVENLDDYIQNFDKYMAKPQ